MTAHEIVVQARKLPQVSEAALKLVELLDDTENNYHEAAELIRSDSLLTAKLLKACNSSALGLAEPVSSVDQALLLLGYDQVMGLVLSLGFGSSMKVALPGYAIEVNGLWRHAFTTATVAETMIRRGLCPAADAAEAFTAGLLHDFGKLIMAQVLPVEAHAAIHQHMAAEGLGSIEAEREVLGTDHAEVGACLLHLWRLPHWIVEAVTCHHRPVLQPRPQLSAIVHLANRVVHIADGGPGAEAYAFHGEEPVVQAFEFEAQEQEELVATVQESAERANELLAVV